MFAFSRVLALMISTVARWIKPYYGSAWAEDFAASFIWLFIAVNMLTIAMLQSPELLISIVTSTSKSMLLLALVLVFFMLRWLLFANRSIEACADDARSRWPTLGRCANWIVGGYAVVTMLAFTAACIVW